MAAHDWLDSQRFWHASHEKTSTWLL